MIAEDDAISCTVLKKTVESLGTGLLKDAPSGVPRTNLPIKTFVAVLCPASVAPSDRGHVASENNYSRQEGE